MKKEKRLDHDPLTEEIIVAAIEVHRHLGPGLLESVYLRAMCIELGLRGCSYEREKTFPLPYKGVVLHTFRPDLIVEQLVVVEVKSVDRYDPVFAAQVLTYLKLTGLRVGLLLDFNREVLSSGIRRFVL